MARSTYPARLRVDYPEEQQDRVRVLFRPLLALPIIVLLGVLTGGGGGQQSDDLLVVVVSSGGVIVLPVLLMIVFRRKYPRWWFDWNLELTRFSNRVGAYFLLLREEYPATDAEQSVHIEIDYPDAEQDLSRWLPLVKWLLAIPHYVVLIVLAVMVVAITVIAWFAILFTGRYPRELFDIVVGWSRWALRVSAYAFLLTTDRYPPFSFDE
ncbi:MAG: DUF4389 domain-containing protein [Chloroflexi bacterium]|nr:DUF4389 domain-containing protein [Chloroflexota bacterium]